MPITKWKHKTIEVKPYDLINVATQSVAHKGDLSEFWQYVQGYRDLGLLKMSLVEIKRILEINGNKIYGQAEETKEHFSKSGNFGLGYEAGGFSGCVPICETPKQKVIIAPDAERKATELLLSLKNYGWVFLSTDEAFHTRLCLDIKFGHQIELKVPGRSRVCLNFSDPAFGLIKKDDVVSLAFSAMFDNNFINHICHFDSGYKERLDAFLGNFRKERNKSDRRGDNNHNLPSIRGGYKATHKVGEQKA